LDEPKFSIVDRVKSFRYAINGLRLLFVREHNARVHLFAAIVAIGLSIYLKLSLLEWVSILSVIAGVFVAEIFNSAIEKLADVVSPEINPKIKVIKDLAAAAVLITAILALAVGGIIFIPKIF
jgi:diacylglycerol kinase (ATP)